MAEYSTYILRCSDNSLYIGHTKSLQDRLEIHNSGKGPLFTRNRRPVTLAYVEEFETEAEAIHRETQIKRWTRTKKEALISGNIERLKQLSKRMNQ